MMKKRMLSILLALVLIIGLLPATAQAGELDNGLLYEVYDDHVEITGYTGEPTEIVIPETIEGLPVTVIGERAFAYCETLTSVDFGSSITSIGAYAFVYCPNLTCIDLGSSLAFIGENAFSGCGGLTSVFIPASVTSIGTGAFVSCYNLTGIHVDPNNPNYSNDTRGILFDKAMTALIRAPYSIRGSYTIPASVTHIEAWAFDHCSFLTNVSIPDSVTTIGDRAFVDCDGLVGIEFSDNITSIGEESFVSCDLITSVYIPASLTHIGRYAFSQCQDLTGIHVDANNPNYSNDSRGVLFNKEKTVLIQAPGAITGFYAIPDGVTDVCFNAFFMSDKLTGISIPSSVTYIDPPFAYCENLTAIYFKGDAPVIDDVFGSMFTGVTATIYYPANNPTWTEDVMLDYGGDITWVPYTPTPFNDVPVGSWFEAPVLWALENGITDGTSDTTFSPGNQCLRAHVVTFLWNAEETPEPTAYTKTFTDVPAGAWYYKPVHWAVEKGITSGVSPNKFGAGDVCSRYQVVFFLWKAAGAPEPKTTVNPFTDVNPGHFFYKAVLWAVENGITSGTSDTTFSPTQPCNRAQVVTFLYKAYT